MVRKIRYRQVLRHRCANHGRGTYAQQVQLQKLFWREDNTPTPTIERVREIHKSLGTWDTHTVWESWRHFTSKRITNEIYIKGQTVIHPKANYKELKKAIKKLKEARWKEQEKRTLEFFEREGC